jgi:peptide/nickel transport system ATP-binding protein
VSASLLDVRDVSRIYSAGSLLTRHRKRAVDGVSFRMAAEQPEILAVVGESGSGKTTLARMILNTVAPSAGSIAFRGTDLSRLRHGRHRMGFMKQVQPVFQNPFEAFNPLKQVDRYLFATARRMAGRRASDAMADCADEALHKVGLSLAEIGGRFPHELSGGQLQRVAIARALIPEPSLLVADEPVSMIDASLRTSIVNLLRTLRDTTGVSIIYITHDLATAYYVSDNILIMHQGRIVERGAARAVLDNPQHPYSIRLKQAVLSPDAAVAGAAVRPPADVREGRVETRDQA